MRTLSGRIYFHTRGLLRGEEQPNLGCKLANLDGNGCVEETTTALRLSNEIPRGFRFLLSLYARIMAEARAFESGIPCLLAPRSLLPALFVEENA